MQIDDDFHYDINSQFIKINPEELRLLYVACTRGRANLDIHHISDLIKGLREKRKVIF